MLCSVGMLKDRELPCEGNYYCAYIKNTMDETKEKEVGVEPLFFRIKSQLRCYSHAWLGEDPQADPELAWEQPPEGAGGSGDSLGINTGTVFILVFHASSLPLCS